MGKKFEKIIFDLDGVIYRGGSIIPGAGEAIGKIRNAGINISFLTNNASLSREGVAQKLSSLGISAKKEEIMASSYAVAHYLNSLSPKPKNVYVVGADGLKDEIKQFGINILSGEEASKSGVDALATGLDKNFNYEKLSTAQFLLHKNILWVA
ncbi:MAG: HAD family hydrolase, partial [Candidatus Micrarchaeota archaeon]